MSSPPLPTNSSPCPLTRRYRARLLPLVRAAMPRAQRATRDEDEWEDDDENAEADEEEEDGWSAGERG